MRIIPAIDILHGKCVRLTQGDYTNQIIYNEDPVEVAKYFEANGMEYLHLVDLDGARSDHIINHDILYAIANQTKLKIDFGGGVKSTRDVITAFENGALQITAGSIAVQNPSLFLGWIAEYGPAKIILGADAQHRMIASHGWTTHSETDVLDFILTYNRQGINHVICTDIAKDGMLQGPAFDLYEEIICNTSVKLIASGGVSSLDDVIRLRTIGCEGAVIGKAIYENKITLSELRDLC